MGNSNILPLSEEEEEEKRERETVERGRR